MSHVSIVFKNPIFMCLFSFIIHCIINIIRGQPDWNQLHWYVLYCFGVYRHEFVHNPQKIFSCCFTFKVTCLISSTITNEKKLYLQQTKIKVVLNVCLPWHCIWFITKLNVQSYQWYLICGTFIHIDMLRSVILIPLIYIQG